MRTPSHFVLILILGALCTVTPLSIDMYLPAFIDIAKALGTTPATISLSVSSYFIGLAAGQLFYGPLLDRFGRKPPLYYGIAIYVLASAGCIMARTPDQLIALRLVQALGGCVAQVGAFAMVRDFFPVSENAKIFSLLMLILGVSPLFAPTIGSLITTTIGWQWVFVSLASVACAVLAVVHFFLPEGHMPDKTISLRPKPIAKNFLAILEEPHFSVAAFAGAFSFAGLFVYVAGSPIIFLDMFHVGPRVYGAIFALLATGFLGSGQINVWLSKRHQDRKIFQTALIGQNVFAFILFVGMWNGWYGLAPTVGLLFLILSCAGIGSPNATAMALAPFSKNAGSAAALLGFIQMGVGALTSAGVGILNFGTAMPVFVVLAASSFIALCILIIGYRRLTSPNPQGL